MADSVERISLWQFLNSSFGLWLCSAIFISGAGALYTNFQASVSERQKKEEIIARLDMEISYRFSRFFDQMNALADTRGVVNPKTEPRLRTGKSKADTVRVFAGLRENGSTALGYLYPEFRAVGLQTLLASLRGHLTGPKRDEVDQAMAQLANRFWDERLDFANLNLVAGTVNKEMLASRWRGSWFGSLDCPWTKPLC